MEDSWKANVSKRFEVLTSRVQTKPKFPSKELRVNNAGKFEFRNLWRISQMQRMSFVDVFFMDSTSKQDKIGGNFSTKICHSTSLIPIPKWPWGRLHRPSRSGIAKSAGANCSIVAHQFKNLCSGVGSWSALTRQDWRPIWAGEKVERWCRLDWIWKANLVQS